GVYAVHVLLIVVALAGAQQHGAIERLAKGAELYDDHDYHAALAELLPARDIKLHAQDYVLWFLGQSAYYAGDRAAALDAFHRLANFKGSRLQNAGALRAADTLFLIGPAPHPPRAHQ